MTRCCSSSTGPAGSVSARAACRQETITSGGLPVALSIWMRHSSACTVLFYPSTMASPLLHTFLLEELWRMGLNVVGLHPLSHGNSPRVKKNFVFDDILRNGLDAAAWIRERFDGPLVVSGHSQGGILTLAHAARDARIAAAFPMCTLLPQHPDAALVTRFHRIRQHRERLLAVLRAGARLLPRLPVIIPFYLEYDRIAAGARSPVSHWKHMRWNYPLCFVSSLFSANLDAACQEGNIRCPVVLMTAQDDALFPPDLMRTMLDCIRAPEKKLVVVENGGHMAPLCPTCATGMAARLAGQCAGYGLPLHLCETGE